MIGTDNAAGALLKLLVRYLRLIDSRARQHEVRFVLGTADHEGYTRRAFRDGGVRVLGKIHRAEHGREIAPGGRNRGRERGKQAIDRKLLQLPDLVGAEPGILE